VFGGGMHLLWGMAILCGVFILVLTGGYHRLETIQLILVLVMLGSVMMSLILIQPDWLAVVQGVWQPHRLAYPAWAQTHEVLKDRPVWIELTTYVGVVGGSGYDYLAYVSYLRAKRWGQAGSVSATAEELQSIANNPRHPNRQWLRAPLIDCTISFAVVFVFSAVFLAAGTEILGAQKRIPGGGDLLTLQAEFLTAGSTWLRPLYFAGAFLAMLGTLYGTIEVAPVILHEAMRALFPERAVRAETWIRGRRLAVIWAGTGGFAILAWMFFHHLLTGSEKPPGLGALLTPANLFTGVFACGIICALALWSDWKWLPKPLRPRWPLTSLSVTAGLLFLVLGVKGYWDHSGALAFLILAGTLALAIALTKAVRKQGGSP
jgi:hypothetical protein